MKRLRPQTEKIILRFSLFTFSIISLLLQSCSQSPIGKKLSESFDMDLNEILTKERDSLRDENIELRKRIHQLEISLQKALDMLENDD